MGLKSDNYDIFQEEAERILDLKPAYLVNSLGGYGPESEAIYDGHPNGCPSVLVDSKNNATVTFMSNGSISFIVKLLNGMEVKVLEGHFDPVEKRECGVPSSNIWIAFKNNKTSCNASLMNPNINTNCKAHKIKIVKIGNPFRAMWFCSFFKSDNGTSFVTAIKYSLVTTSKGPVLLRQVFIKNTGKKLFNSTLWTYFNLHGTQRFVYNKELWYDAGYPATPNDIIMTATVPYSEVLQIKRINSLTLNAKPIESTCDYTTFIGDTSALAVMPQAVLFGKMLEGGAGPKINRFATAAIGATRFEFKLNSNKYAIINQSLLYVTDKDAIDVFKKESGYIDPTYRAMSKSFEKASATLIKSTTSAISESFLPKDAGGEHWPYFEVGLFSERAVAEYANSVWVGVSELYENCRAHGARLADGIELGTRDRGQDMWPKMKEDPGRVRADLVYVMGFMYITNDGPFPTDRQLLLREKLHGMFPRQYPSQWNNRNTEIKNDNRPYTDSPVWLINSINMYIRETGDTSILLETVPTIRLTDPDHPETSGITGCSKTYRIAEVIREIFANFERNAADCPYGIVQVLYGDWADPFDMFGTSQVRNAATRGQGRGVQVRLSAHVFSTLIETIDIFESRKVLSSFNETGIHINTGKLKSFSNELRKNIVKVAWEDGPKGFPSAFLDFIHELKVDGTTPDYASGETGYTLGSYLGRDSDGIKRRELTAQSFCLKMLYTKRQYLEDVPGSDEIIQKILYTVDKLFYNDKLGLVMFTKPIANNRDSVELMGRMGVLPAGCAENGEYHHCQVFMHNYRLAIPGQIDTVWRQFKPMMSALRDEGLAGPFETPCTSYISDVNDPHFGKGMYFGLSGSVDWIIEIFQTIAGVKLALHDGTLPAVSISPNLPSVLDHNLSFRRIIHMSEGICKYRQIPFSLEISKQGSGKVLKQTLVTINNEPKERPEVTNLKDMQKLDIKMTYIFSK